MVSCYFRFAIHLGAETMILRYELSTHACWWYTRSGIYSTEFIYKVPDPRNWGTYTVGLSSHYYPRPRGTRLSYHSNRKIMAITYGYVYKKPLFSFVQRFMIMSVSSGLAIERCSAIVILSGRRKPWHSIWPPSRDVFAVCMKLMPVSDIPGCRAINRYVPACDIIRVVFIYLNTRGSN